MPRRVSSLNKSSLDRTSLHLYCCSEPNRLSRQNISNSRNISKAEQAKHFETSFRNIPKFETFRNISKAEQAKHFETFRNSKHFEIRTGFQVKTFR